MVAFAYPEQGDHETGAEYYARVRAMGLPYPWETEKVCPPGPIEVTYEWSTRDSHGVGWLAATEYEARERLMTAPSYTLHRRTRWVALGDWEDVAHGPADR